MKFRLVQDLAADDFPVAVACRILNVSTSGFYEWRDRPPSARQIANDALLGEIREVHVWSRRSYARR